MGKKKKGGNKEKEVKSTEEETKPQAQAQAQPPPSEGPKVEEVQAGTSDVKKQRGKKGKKQEVEQQHEPSPPPPIQSSGRGVKRDSPPEQGRGRGSINIGRGQQSASRESTPGPVGAQSPGYRPSPPGVVASGPPPVSAWGQRPAQQAPPPGHMQQAGPGPAQRAPPAGPPPGLGQRPSQQGQQQAGPPQQVPVQAGQPVSSWGQRPAQQGQQQVGPPQQVPVQAGPPVSSWGQRPAQQGPPPGHMQQAGPAQQAPPAGFVQTGPPPGWGQRPAQQGPPPGQMQQAGPPQHPGGQPRAQQQQQQPPVQQQQQQQQPPVQQQQQPPAQQQQQKGGGKQSKGGKGKQGGQPQATPSPTPGASPARQPPSQAVAGVTAKMQSIKIQDKISRSGSAGRRIPVLTNHFELRLGRVKKVIHYDVDIQPDTPKKLLKTAFQYFRHVHFPKCNPAFDGRKNAYSAVKLPFGDSVSGKVVVEEEGTRSREFTIKMQEVNIVDLESVNQFLKQAYGNQVMEAPMEALQAIDIVFRHSLMMQKIVVGRSFFSQPTGNIIDLGNGMEMYRGLFQAVTLGWKPYLNIDVANKAFPKCQAVISLIQELCPRADLNNTLYANDSDVFLKFIKGLRVEYNLQNKPAMKKRIRVNGIGPPAESNFFPYKNDKGQEQRITVLQYYQMVYGIRLRYPKLPCLWVGALQKEQKTYLPCEFCTILPGQAVQRKLDANQTREMIKQCATNTDVRKNSIKTLLSGANYNADATVNEFDLKVSNDFLNLDARVLVPPNLRYKQQIAPVKRGVWNATHFLEGKDVRDWTILNLDGRTKNEALEKLASFLQNGSRNLGMNMNQVTKPFQAIQTYRNNRLHDDLTKYFQSKSNMQIIFVVIPDADKTYNFVKQAAELAVGSLTQCIKAGTVFKKLNPATIGNILLKVNAKLNGANHSLEKTPTIMKQPTMIMGADVTHPSPDATSIPSVAAVTASHDPKAFKYNICWRLQPPTEEVISDMENITIEHIRYFINMNKMPPGRIVFYRDGVSDGQFRQVLHEELMAIRRACSKINPNYKPSITFIVVQKRHHTRFFPGNPRDSEDRNCNVPAGTCVDTEIVHPTRQNFFLVSHASIQGVAKPTKYVTLWDDNNFSNDDLQSLTYELCHMFARCTRSVSYPAPTYYAHLAAARAKVYIETMQLNMNDLAREQEKFKIKDHIVKEMPMFFV